MTIVVTPYCSSHILIIRLVRVLNSQSTLVWRRPATMNGMPRKPNLLLQIKFISSVRNTTSHKTFAILARPRQDKVAEVLDAFGAESIGLGVGGDILFEDEVLRVVKGVDGPVFGFDCGCRLVTVFVPGNGCTDDRQSGYIPPSCMFGSPKLAKLIHILVICLATLMYVSRLGPPSGFGLPFCG